MSSLCRQGSRSSHSLTPLDCQAGAGQITGGSVGRGQVSLVRIPIDQAVTREEDEHGIVLLDQALGQPTLKCLGHGLPLDRPWGLLVDDREEVILVVSIIVAKDVTHGLNSLAANKSGSRPLLPPRYLSIPMMTAQRAW